jgi:predicted N-acetyltransferase YhbS
MINIHPMKPSDIPFAKSLTDREAWGHVISDFERLIALDPAGCFVAWDNDERVGIATTVTYGRYAFLGNIIVQHNRRGGIIGPQLMQHAIAYLSASGVKTIELDGVLAAVAMYRHMGFREKYRSLRLVRSPADEQRSCEGISSCKEPVNNLVRFDYEKTGIRRQHLISRLVEEFPDRMFCLKEECLKAYALARERATGVVGFGPVVADDATAFSDLLSQVLPVFHGRTITIGIPEANMAGVELLEQNGFTCRTFSMRMYRGVRIEYEKNIYGIVSADVG